MDHDKYSLPILITAIFVIVMISIIDFFFIKSIERNNYLAWTGILLMAIGLVIRRIAIHSLGKHFTWKVQIFSMHELVKEGIYRYIRHPGYTGGALILGGFVIFNHSIYGFILMLLSAPFLFYRIHIEEKALAEKFGNEYMSYKKKTKMLVPFLF